MQKHTNGCSYGRFLRSLNIRRRPFTVNKTTTIQRSASLSHLSLRAFSFIGSKLQSRNPHMFTAVNVAAHSAAPRSVKTALTRTHHDEWIDHAGRMRRGRFAPLILTDCPRSLDQAFVVSRLRITRREYFTSGGLGCTGARISPIYSSARPRRTRSHWKWQTHDASSQNIGGTTRRILIIKIDVTVPVITIFHIAPNEIEWTGGINFVAVAINGECDLFARAPRHRFVSPLFYYNFQSRLIQYHRSY